MDAGIWVHLESVRKLLAAAEAGRIAQDNLHFPCQKEDDELYSVMCLTQPKEGKWTKLRVKAHKTWFRYRDLKSYLADQQCIPVRVSTEGKKAEWEKLPCTLISFGILLISVLGPWGGPRVPSVLSRQMWWLRALREQRTAPLLPPGTPAMFPWEQRHKDFCKSWRC